MVSNAVEFASTLDTRGYQGLELWLKVFEGAGHEQATMLVRGLKAVYSGAKASRPG
jgi:hypothetical protein